ncbi:SAM-dependent methyltransferase [Planosporangium sp. 12N6]|uniref:SAM-dependent methyltransferase n=1 Tax=Planosporangium spinosum TaxID=3402278 RepID=UPI003CF761F2
MERPRWAPADIDLTRPSPARVYDYFLGGTHNVAIDREIADRAIAAAPELPYGARSNRAFLGRAVRFMAADGVAQFIDIGSGIPTQEPTHEVAGQGHPDACVVYVDNDPIAVAHSRALLTDDDHGGVVQADVRDPRSVLDSDVVRSMIDFSRPVGLLMLAVLHFIPDEADPLGIIKTFADMLAPGSYLAISHVSPAPGVDMDELKRQMRQGATPSYLRDPDEIARLFAGWELLEPGLVPPALWRPDGAPGPQAFRVPGLAGVARLP